jgi:hypothetical protein
MPSWHVSKASYGPGGRYSTYADKGIDSLKRACRQYNNDCVLDGHLLLYTLSHIEPSGNAPMRPGYNELTLQLATAACQSYPTSKS